MTGCGCRVEYGERPRREQPIGTMFGPPGEPKPTADRIVYCPLHAAAFDLLTALHARVNHADGCVGHRECGAFDVDAFAEGRYLVERLWP